jgi:hypothetical protein
MASANTEVAKHGYFRVHFHPKRFPRAYAVDWKSRILMDTDDFVAVSKPWGVQVTHRVDNIRESVVACVSQVSIFLRLCTG